MTPPVFPPLPPGLVLTLDIDASGLACPLPLLKAKQGLHQLQVGQCLRVMATDKGSLRDFQAFANLSEHRLLSSTESGGYFEYILEKGAKA